MGSKTPPCVQFFAGEDSDGQVKLYVSFGGKEHRRVDDTDWNIWELWHATQKQVAGNVGVMLPISFDGMTNLPARIAELISRERRIGLRKIYEAYRDDDNLGTPKEYLHICYVRELLDVLDRLEEGKDEPK